MDFDIPTSYFLNPLALDQATCLNLQLHMYEYRNDQSNGTSLVALSTGFNYIKHLSKNTVEPPYATSYHK